MPVEHPDGNIYVITTCDQSSGSSVYTQRILGECTQAEAWEYFDAMNPKITQANSRLVSLEKPETLKGN